MCSYSPLPLASETKCGNIIPDSHECGSAGETGRSGSCSFWSLLRTSECRISHSFPQRCPPDRIHAKRHRTAAFSWKRKVNNNPIPTLLYRQMQREGWSFFSSFQMSKAVLKVGGAQYFPGPPMSPQVPPLPAALWNRSSLASSSASTEAIPKHRTRGTRGQNQRFLYAKASTCPEASLCFPSLARSISHC